MYSRDVLCIVVFLDVNGQKLLLSETLVAGDAGEGFLSSVGSDVNGQVALLGGRRENKPLSSSQGGFGIRPYSLCSFFFFPLPKDACTMKKNHSADVPYTARC